MHCPGEHATLTSQSESWLYVPARTAKSIVCIYAPDLECIVQVSMEGKAIMDGERERQRERAHTLTHERVSARAREGEREGERERGEKEEGP